VTWGTTKIWSRWRKAIELVAAIYRLTDGFPKFEIYGLTSQIRRAAVSVPSNIAEGQANFRNWEFTHFLRHARGSLAELETQIMIAEKLKYLSEVQLSTILKQVDEVSRMLAGLIAAISREKCAS
jgi:four helix bundle protein